MRHVHALAWKPAAAFALISALSSVVTAIETAAQISPSQWGQHTIREPVRGRALRGRNGVGARWRSPEIDAKLEARNRKSLA